MKTFKVDIIEKLCKTIEVEALTEGQAIRRAQAIYNRDDVELNANDLFNTDFIINKD